MRAAGPAGPGVTIAALVLVAGLVATPAAGAGGPAPAFGNALASSSSAYLRSVAASPVAWQPWGAEAFALARRLDRPVLLSIGAGWCHWCHVMDRQVYADPGIASLLNAEFVPIKVDRDERPDIDARYQQVARTVFDTGGWPLTLVLTADGKTVTAGATFLADERDGLPGLRQFLPRVLAVYRTRRAEFFATGDAAHRLLATPDLSAGAPRDPSSLADEILKATVARFDPVHGGFGEQAKHVPGPILSLTARRYAETGERLLRDVFVRTLDAMAAGAIRDHLGGGFFRYTSDRAWREPHFEKLEYVQAQMLLAYLQGHQMTGDPAYRAVAEEILGYVRRALERPGGGFRAHQDAEGRNADAGHYLWTADDVRATAPLEADLLVRHFGLSDAARRAPAVALSATQLGRETGQEPDAVEASLAPGKAALLAARARRGEPAVDETVYADRSALMVSAYLEAYRVLGDESARDVALGTLAFLQSRLSEADGGLAHAYAAERVTVPGFLADQVAVAAAHLEAFEVTGDRAHVERARTLMRVAVARFREPTSAFIDRVASPQEAPGAREPLRPYLDEEMPAANPLAALVLERLYAITGEGEYHRLARETLAAFRSSAARLGPLLASYGLAMDVVAGGSIHAVIVGRGTDPRARALWRTALGAFRPGKSVLFLDPASSEPVPLPPPMAAMLAQVGTTGQPDAPPQAYVCSGRLCALPTSDPARLHTLLQSFDRGRR